MTKINMSKLRKKFLPSARVHECNIKNEPIIYGINELWYYLSCCTFYKHPKKDLLIIDLNHIKNFHFLEKNANDFGSTPRSI